MFGLGLGEILLILVVTLVVFGPNRLPDLARMLGKGMAEFRRASRDLRETFETELHRTEVDNRSHSPRKEPRLLDAELEPYPPREEAEQQNSVASQSPEARRIQVQTGDEAKNSEANG